MRLDDAYFMAAAAEPALPFDARVIRASGMTVRFWRDSDRINVIMAAPTTGWMCVGFSQSGSLSGSRLVMARLHAGQVDVEEHIATPPTHKKRTGGTPSWAVGGLVEHGHTIIAARVPLDPRDPNRPQDVLTPGRRLTMVLAYSQRAGFYEQSAMRQVVETRV